jgi:hypothetical protein
MIGSPPYRPNNGALRLRGTYRSIPLRDFKCDKLAFEGAAQTTYAT